MDLTWIWEPPVPQRRDHDKQAQPQADPRPLPSRQLSVLGPAAVGLVQRWARGGDWLIAGLSACLSYELTPPTKVFRLSPGLVINHSLHQHQVNYAI